MRRFLATFLVVLGESVRTYACSCDGGIVDCSYASADVVFRGVVDFDNDDGNGTFVQRTLIGLQVKEPFKGLPADTKHVWIDPGSFTSCYAVYKMGEEYLVFAANIPRKPARTAGMTVAWRGESPKQLPKEFRGYNPPTVYLARECMGTRDTHYPDFDKDLVSLRRYASGAQVAPIMGQILLAPNDPWSGKGRLEGAEVLVDTPAGLWRTTTNSDGKFFFDRTLEDGAYAITASYPGAETQHAVLHAHSKGCSYVFLFLYPKHSAPKP